MRTILFVLLLPSCAFAQELIHFNNGKWWQIMTEAKQAQKPIFIDFYTDWCGGCKMMEQQVLPNTRVVSKFNTSFINYKINAESFEGISIAQRFKIECFPTYVFVDPNTGKTLFKEDGMMLEIPKFLGYANTALSKFKKIAVAPIAPPAPAKAKVLPKKMAKKPIIKKKTNKTAAKKKKPTKRALVVKKKLIKKKLSKKH